MDSRHLTKEQLRRELIAARRRIAEQEVLETTRQRSGEVLFKAKEELEREVKERTG